MFDIGYVQQELSAGVFGSLSKIYLKLTKNHLVFVTCLTLATNKIL